MSLRDADRVIDIAAGEDLSASLDGMSKEELALLKWRLEWKQTARAKQLVPETHWKTYGAMAGRGFGKTRMGANWLGIEACSDPGSFNFVIAPTRDDVRYVCFEGETGLFAYIPDCLIVDYNKSDLIIYLWNGAIIRGFGSERPERLRGPQHHRGWCDELAAWQYSKKCWDMMQFGLRLGEYTQVLWTTTPKPVPIIKERVLEENTDHIIVRGTTYENRANLSDSFYQEIAKYEGTKLGRQEIHGELIDPEESGIVKRSQWKIWPAKKPLPRFIHIVSSLDTAFTERTFDAKEMEADPTACSVWGLFYIGKLLNVMLLDAWDDYLGLPELIKRVREESKVTYGKADEPLLGQTLVPSPYLSREGVMVGRPTDIHLIEDKGSGISLRQMLGMENLLLEKYNPGKADKLSRLHSVTPMFAHGRVWCAESIKFPNQPTTWAEGLIGQVCSYHGPGTTEHDDYVDTTTQALIYFMRKFVHTFIPLDPQSVQKQDEDDYLKRHSRDPSQKGGGGNPYLQ